MRYENKLKSALELCDRDMPDPLVKLAARQGRDFPARQLRVPSDLRPVPTIRILGNIGDLSESRVRFTMFPRIQCAYSSDGFEDPSSAVDG